MLTEIFIDGLSLHIGSVFGFWLLMYCFHFKRNCYEIFQDVKSFVISFESYSSPSYFKLTVRVVYLATLRLYISVIYLKKN